ncbi:MAG: nucleotide exchange factor GrpE [Candidatus Paceibacterota bacterium]|jgi:molecular chaperone GrpE
MNKKDSDNDIISEQESENLAVDTDNLDDSVVAEENAVEAIKKLREKLKKAEQEKQEYLVGWQRAKADHINARKRDESEKQEFVKFANERLIDGLIPVMESFDMAMGNKEVWEKVDKNWRVGVEYIYSQLKKVLSDAGLEEINPIGKPFDLNRDEASEYVPVEKETDHHKVLAVVQKGYTLNDKLMRPPKVKVGEFKKE